MIPDFESFHGVALRSIIVASVGGVHIAPSDKYGRVNSYLVNGHAAIYIKHSGNRLSPWTFSFSVAHLRELLHLRKQTERVWLLFVCGHDGVACISLDEFLTITGARPGGVAYLRIERHRNTRYHVFGNERGLDRTIPRGVSRLLHDLQN